VAIMLNNRFHLKRTAGLPLPYVQALIFTVSLTTTASLNCHWVSQDKEGDDVFWTKQLASWDLFSMEPDTLNKARRAIRNCIEYARRNSFDEIQANLVVICTRYLTPLAVEDAIEAIKNQEAPTTDVADTLLEPSTSIDAQTSHAPSPEQSQNSPLTPVSLQPAGSYRTRKPTPSMDQAALGCHKPKK